MPVSIIYRCVLCQHEPFDCTCVACVFVSLCEVISGVLFAVDHLTASFALNSFLCNSLADPVTDD